MHTRISVGPGQACLPRAPARAGGWRGTPELAPVHATLAAAEQLARMAEALDMLLQMQQRTAEDAGLEQRFTGLR
jgi:hypothetical protein